MGVGLGLGSGVGVNSLSSRGPEDDDSGCRTDVGLALAAAADIGSLDNAFVFGTGTGVGVNSLSSRGPGAGNGLAELDEDDGSCHTGVGFDGCLVLDEELATAADGNGLGGALVFGTGTSSPHFSSPPPTGGVNNLSNGGPVDGRKGGSIRRFRFGYDIAAEAIAFRLTIAKASLSRGWLGVIVKEDDDRAGAGGVVSTRLRFGHA
ncbi:hypothetical protein PM082_014093 [Marasmius tenuissimus]|nr:hypothetical protein PM082_014093 [Marasmius tenuissimus]